MSFWVSAKRILRSGVVSFWRNGFVSLASVFVITMTLFIIGSLMFLNGAVGQFVEYVKDKVDVNVYFVPEANDEEIARLAETIQNLPEVSGVVYTSREEVLSQFRERHRDNLLTLQALEELGDNPFGATLSIKAHEPSQYAGVAQFLDDYASSATGERLIDEINYFNNQGVIEQLERIITFVERFGLMVILLFAFASILITFNTVRLAIYTAREEISVMRLVGASNQYIRGPFVIEGALYGLISGVIALILFFPITLTLRGAIEAAFGVDMFGMYLDQFFVFTLVLIGTGIILGALSSFLAVRKYLSV